MKANEPRSGLQELIVPDLPEGEYEIFFFDEKGYKYGPVKYTKSTNTPNKQGWPEDSKTDNFDSLKDHFGVKKSKPKQAKTKEATKEDPDISKVQF